MFFTIAKSPHTELTEQHQIGDWTICTDRGWKASRSATGLVLEKGLLDTDCVITCDGHDWQIHTKVLRRFPLWCSESGDFVSNLVVAEKRIDNPHQLSYHNGKPLVKHRHSPHWLMPAHNKTLSRQQVEEKICDNLVRQTESLRAVLPDHDLPVIAPISKGVDCALVRAALDYCGVPYSSQKISVKSIDKDKVGDREHLWGYRQMMDEGQPHIQATGYFGDARLFRHFPYLVGFMRKWNIDLAEEFDKAGHTYMRNTFDRNFRHKLSNMHDTEDMTKTLIDQMINDFQIWHIDDCLTWTPLADIEIMRLGLSIDPDTALDQILHAGLSKSLIKRLSPRRLDEIQKNHNGN
jgi:hypothetical protein